jgi:hypothetical protein
MAATAVRPKFQRVLVLFTKFGSVNGNDYASLHLTFPDEMGEDDVGMAGIQTMTMKCPPRIAQYLVNSKKLPALCDISTRTRMSGQPPKPVLQVTDLVLIEKSHEPIRNFMMTLELGDAVVGLEMPTSTEGSPQVVTEAGVVDSGTGEIIDPVSSSSSSYSSKW